MLCHPLVTWNCPTGVAPCALMAPNAAAMITTVRIATITARGERRLRIKPIAAGGAGAVKRSAPYPGAAANPIRPASCARRRSRVQSAVSGVSLVEASRWASA